MPKRDTIHEAVVNALVKEGWEITADPYTLKYGDQSLDVDLAAERLLAAQRGEEKIAVEIKSFISRSPMHDLETALGQHNLYASILEEVEPTRKLFLAVSETVYDTLLEIEAFHLVVKRYRVAMFVVALAAEEILQWIP